MNTNCSQYRLKDITKSVAFHLSDDVLAMHLQLFVERIASILVWLYVAGQMTAEVVRPYVTRMGDWMAPLVTRFRDGNQAVLAETLTEEALN